MKEMRSWPKPFSFYFFSIFWPAVVQACAVFPDRLKVTKQKYPIVLHPHQDRRQIALVVVLFV